MPQCKAKTFMDELKKVGWTASKINKRRLNVMLQEPLVISGRSYVNLSGVNFMDDKGHSFENNTPRIIIEKSKVQNPGAIVADVIELRGGTRPIAGKCESFMSFKYASRAILDNVKVILFAELFDEHGVLDVKNCEEIEVLDASLVIAKNCPNLVGFREKTVRVNLTGPNKVDDFGQAENIMLKDFEGETITALNAKNLHIKNAPNLKELIIDPSKISALDINDAPKLADYKSGNGYFMASFSQRNAVMMFDENRSVVIGGGKHIGVGKDAIADIKSGKRPAELDI